jgi:PIN domain nuclease of toxin-antitoxin system
VSADSRLSNKATQLIQNEQNIFLISTACIWEMGVKSALGKLKINKPYDEFLFFHFQNKQLQVFDITLSHILEAVSFPHFHRDPFDRLLAAQSKIENLPVISNDTMLDKYGIERVW